MHAVLHRAHRRRTAGCLLAATVACLMGPVAWAAPGDPDPAFGFEGQLLIEAGPTIELARAVGSLPDGRIVVAGTVDVAVPGDACAVAMLLPDGSLDPGFGVDGKVLLDFDPARSNVCEDLLVQPDGRIVLVGHRTFGLFNNKDFMVIRLNTDGSPDTGFSDNGYQFVNFNLVQGSVDQAHAVALQADGKLVVAGKAERGPGDFDLAVARINADGTLDPSFSADGRASLGVDLGGPSVEEAWAVAVQADGRIVLAGDSLAGGEYALLVARLTAGGVADSSFNLVGYRQLGFGVVPSARARGLAIRPDGTLLIGGYAHNELTSDFAALALLANGQNDSGFGINGQVTIDFPSGLDSIDAARAMAVDAQGRLVLGGLSGTEANIDFAAVRLLANGMPDPTFGVQGRVTIPFDVGLAPYVTDDGHDIPVLPDGGILLAGGATLGATESDMALVKLQGGPDADQLFGHGFELSP